MFPALYPFLSQDRWLSYLKSCMGLDDVEMAQASTLLQKQLIPIINGRELGFYLGISPALVNHMALFTNVYYRTFEIPKKDGKARTITAPRIFLKTVQRYILSCILSQQQMHNAVHGFMLDRDCGTGAAIHVGKRFLWNIDLKDFFPTISFFQVAEVFRRIGYANRPATFLAKLCCHNGHLPQGAPTSPAISNLVFSSADSLIYLEAERHAVAYTRYADDLSFSSNSPVATEFQTKIKQIIENCGFCINPRKSRLMGPRTRREVTGLTINRQVSIPRVKRRQLRSFFHQINKNPEQFGEQKERAIGFASWVFHYHENEGRKYLRIAHSIPD